MAGSEGKFTTMNDSEEKNQGPEKPRPYKWRYGPARLAMPWISVAVGIFFFFLVRNSGGIGRGGSHDTTFGFVFGLALIALGIIFFFVYRWMAKRGL